MKKLMILGSEKYFENLVKSAREEGIYTIVCDSRLNTPAKKICDEEISVDIFDYESLKRIAIEKQIDGVVTGFSDVLIKPYTYLANELGLPCVITNEQLEKVTNKMIMKKIFKDHNISSTEFVIISNKEEFELLSPLKYPLIMKPIDSSGSKGIYIVNSIKEVKRYIDKVKEYSTNGKVIIEEFYNSVEIQGLSWVYNGEAHVLYVGDRELVNIHRHRPGKPERLLYPSKYCFQYEDEIKELYQKIADAFQIKNGPIYVQMLVGKEGIKVAEMMTRLPGGCDYLAVKNVTGFDAGKLMVNFSVGNDINFDEVKKYNMHLKRCAYALPIYIKPGEIAQINNVKEIEELDYVSEFLLHVKEGDSVLDSGDLRQDCGRVYGIANNLFDADEKKRILHNMIEFIDKDGGNMIENFIKETSYEDYNS